MTSFSAGSATLVLTAGLTLACAGVRAGEAPPAPSAPRAVGLPAPERFELSNGLKVTLVQFGNVPKATIVVTVRAGNLNQGSAVWLPDLMGEMLKEGTRRRSAQDISTAAAAMGGQLGVNVGAEETSLSLDVLSESLPDAARLVAEVLQEPAFPASELPRIRQNYLRNLSVVRSQAQSQAGVAFASLMYGEHPFGQVLPTDEQLASYTIDDIRRFHAENFGAARAHVYVAGRFDTAAIRTVLGEAFAGWVRGPEPVMLPPAPSRQLRVRLVNRQDAPQSTIRFGMPVVSAEHPDFMATSVMNTLLGGSITSRITMNLREDKGWAYSPGSSVSARYRDSVWTESADVTTSATGAALSEIFREIRRLQDEPPPASELDLVKRYRNGLFVLGTATRGGLIGQLGFMNLHGLPEDWLTTFVERLYAVTPEQVSAMARDQLKLDEATLVVVGDVATVRPQLQALPELAGVTLE